VSGKAKIARGVGGGGHKPFSHPGRCEQVSTIWTSAYTEANTLKAAANEALGVENGVARVHGSLVFCGIADEALIGREGDIRRGRAVAL